MDTGDGKFVQFSDVEEVPELERRYPDHGGIFHKGEIVELKGSIFKVKTISPKELRLKLLKKGVA